MKKIFIIIIATLFSLSLFGQNKFNYEIQAKGGLSIGNGQVKIDSIVKFGSTIKFFSLGAELSVGSSSGDFGEANITITGTTTTGSLQVGDPDSHTIATIDSILTDGTTFSIYSGGTQLAPNIPSSGAGELGDYAMLLDDSTSGATYGAKYVTNTQLKSTLTPRYNNTSALGSTSLMYSDLFLGDGAVINFDNGNVTLTHSANEIRLSGGRLYATYSNDGGETIYGLNTGTTTLSKGIYGRSHATGGTGEYYGIYGQANATNTGRNVGVYGIAGNGSENYAGFFAGNIKTTGTLVVGVDTCKGTQTKDVTTTGFLRVIDTCTLNGLAGGEPGQILYILNTKATTLILKHNGAGTQKFFISGAADATLNDQGDYATCLFDGQYWYLTGRAE